MHAAGLAVAALAADARAAPDADLVAALELAGGADVVSDIVSIDLPATPKAPHVRAATVVRATPAAIVGVLLDAPHFRAVIPSMIRSQVEPTGNTLPPNTWRVDWELEIPLFNLSGKLELRLLPDGAEMVLTDDDLAPGRVAFRVAPLPDGRSSILEVDAVADVHRSTFFIRQVMNRSPYGEPAALAAVAYVAMRATALRAEHLDMPGTWRPGAPIAPPRDWAPDTRPLADPRLAPLRARGALCLVARRPNERLAGVAVARQLNFPAAALDAALRDPQRWNAFPGWRKIQIVAPAAPAAPGAPPSATVEDGIPFVDFDATWQGLPGPAARWIASAGAAQGARLGWDVLAAGEGAPAVVALTLYPRLEQTGGIPRRFIAAEPLLEHGLALALAFVDAWSVLGSLAAPTGKPR
jgi:hypothetical protein